jgi:Tfp pilus assembly protein PilO
MDLNKLWLIGSVLVTSVIVVLGVLLGIQPQLESMNAAQMSRAAVEVTNAEHVALLARLKHDFKNIDTLSTTAQVLAESVPSGSAMPELVDELDAHAVQAGLTLTGMSVSEARAYVPVVPVAAVPSADAAAPVEAPAAEAGLVTTGTTPVATTTTEITASNFAAFPLKVNVKGSYAQVLAFVARLQSGSRLFLVDGLNTVTVDGEPDVVNATISGLVYSLVAPAPVSAG